MKRSLFIWSWLFAAMVQFVPFSVAQHNYGAAGHSGRSVAGVSTPAAPESQVAFQKIVAEYYRIHDSLANDTTAGVDSAARSIAKLASEAAKQSAGKSPDFGAMSRAAAALPGTNLEQARSQFFELGKPIIAELKRNGAISKSAFAYKCGMANKTWVQGKKEVRNPYYGKSMEKCGEPL